MLFRKDDVWKMGLINVYGSIGELPDKCRRKAILRLREWVRILIGIHGIAGSMSAYHEGMQSEHYNDNDVKE